MSWEDEQRNLRGFAFMDDLAAETRREQRREPDRDNPDDGLNRKDQDEQARLEPRPTEPPA